VDIIVSLSVFIRVLAVPVDGDLQATLGSGLDQLVDGFLDLLLDVVHYRSPPW
jgi:hypothetical protein